MTFTTNKANVFSPVHKICCHVPLYSFMRGGGETFCMLDKSGVGEYEDVKPAV